MMQAVILSFGMWVVLAGTLTAQRIIGYYPYYRHYLYQKVDFAQLTDVTYAWLNADRRGNLRLNQTFHTADFACLVETARAVNPAIRIHVSSGGWGYSDWLYPVASHPELRQHFAEQLADFLLQHQLDGWDLDWEFPTTAAKQQAHFDLIRTVREEFDRRQAATGRVLELSIAVGGDAGPYGHARFYQRELAQYLDYITIMAYDDGNSVNHSGLDFAMAALRGYQEQVGWPAHKLVLGVPFYGRRPRNGSARSFGKISSLSFNALTQDTDGEFHYNGLPMLCAKADSVFARYGGQGLAIWELGHDHPERDCSLLRELNTYVQRRYWVPRQYVQALQRSGLTELLPGLDLRAHHSYAPPVR